MKRIIAILLSLVILFSTTGFTLVTHFCGGVASESKVVLFGEAPGCGMEETESDCDDNGVNYTKKSCCDNERIQVKIEDEYERAVKAEGATSLEFLTAWVFTVFNLPETLFANIYADYAPPPLLINRTIAHQVFRI